jgi:hypothetical protein
LCFARIVREEIHNSTAALRAIELRLGSQINRPNSSTLAATSRIVLHASFDSARANGICQIKRDLLMTVFLAGTAVSQDLAGENMKSLDGQVQEIKSDVLDIASDLRNLEERLLYPSGTQLAIFVAVEEQQDFRLDAVQIEIDGELATHHIYSFNELEALQKGGVQKAYAGNVVTGDHELRVTVIGKTDSGKGLQQHRHVCIRERRQAEDARRHAG